MTAAATLTPHPPSTPPTPAPLNVSRLVESRPAAYRWPARASTAQHPAQPPLDLRPVAQPVPATPAVALDLGADPARPDARAWAVALATTLVEVVAAQRSSSQLSRWLAADVLAELPRLLPPRPARVALRAAAPGGTPRLQSVRVQRPCAGVAEVAVHARFGPRSLALALRLEAHRSRWLCTALVVAPAGPGGGEGRS